jgi:hypothetical protein
MVLTLSEPLSLQFIAKLKGRVVKRISVIEEVKYVT